MKAYTVKVMTFAGVIEVEVKASGRKHARRVATRILPPIYQAVALSAAPSKRHPSMISVDKQRGSC